VRAEHLLEGVRDLQHTDVVAGSADDLQADRQPTGVNPAGTDAAGTRRTLTTYAERIQAR
jgi:hypothetical protein